jgi:competence protein ComEC
MTKKVFYFFVISFFIGIFFESFFNTKLIELFFVLFVFSIFFLVSTFLKKKTSKNFKKLFLFFVFLLGFFLGALRLEVFQKNNVGEFENLVNKKIEKKFVVVEEPEEKNAKTKLILRFQNSKSRAVLWTESFPERSYGDLLLVSGFLNYPENFTPKEGDRVFDYVSYLKKEKIFYQIKPVKITHLAKDNGNFLKKYLFKIKNSFLSQIKKLIPDPEASLLGGVLLGAKEDIDKDMLEDFRKTGIIHIVVLSGYNLTLVADFFIKIFAFLGITLSAVFGAVSIIFFTIMTGASSTIIRASLMALLILFARSTGRTSETVRALFLAGFLMLSFNPMLLVFDPSFQLSFLATLGLLIFSPKIEERLTFIPKKFLDMRGILAATLATQVFVFPLLLYMMGEISVISPVVNILVLIFIPFVMFLGLVAVLVSYLNFHIGLLFAYVVYLLLAYDLFLVEFFASFPYAVFESKVFTFWFMVS